MGVYQIGEVIKKQRESLGLTQMELCDGICSPETLSRIENGKRSPSGLNFRALMNRMGKSGEKYIPFIHCKDIETIMEAMNIDILLARRKYEEVDVILENLKLKIDLEDSVNRQFYTKTRAIVDYYMGKIGLETKRERLVEAFLCTIPSYEEGKLAPGIYSRHEIFIFCNIACTYLEEKNWEMAVKMLKQVEKYFKTTQISSDERAISETLMMDNLEQCLGDSGNTKVAISVIEKAIKISLEGDNTNLLGVFCMTLHMKKKIWEKKKPVKNY